MKILNKKYNISNNLNKKIVLISDIHYSGKEDIKTLNYVLDNIKKVKPNYICITGDTIDTANPNNFNLIKNWLTKLSKIAKVIMIFGNHEFYIDKKNNKYGLNDKTINEIKNIDNLYLLDNKNVIIDNINFIGLTLPIEHYMVNSESEEDFKKYIKSIKTYKKYYNILLCHSPLNISRKNLIKDINVDLVLCGHMHGGLTPNFLKPIFKNIGFISPQKTLFPKCAYGKIKINNKNIIITSGIKVMSKSSFKYIKNIFASEVVEINI